MRVGGPVAGTHFWAWGGEGRAQHADHHFQPGDTSYVGDPPHEPQGWYSVFDVDASTQAVIRNHAAAVKALPLYPVAPAVPTPQQPTERG